jgi:DNA-binding transcriptional LysR family regulator
VLAAKVERGELDAALASNPPAPLPRLLLWHPLLNEPFVFIAPRRFAGATISEALARYPFIRLTRHTWTGRMVESALRAARLAPRDAMELDSTDIVSEMVGRGLGVSVIPLDDGKWRDNPALRILRIRGLTAERVVGLVERRSHSKAALVAAFRQCLAGVRRSARGRLREIPIA